MLDSMRGDMSAQGADASLPATTNHKAGDVYRSNDLPYLYMFNGSSWVKYPVGGKVLLEQHAASGSATLDFTTAITSAFDEYEFEIVSLVPANDGVELLMTLSTNGGSSFSSTTYNSILLQFATNAASGQPAGPTSSFRLNNGFTNVGNYSLCGSYTLYNPLSSSLYKILKGMSYGRISSGDSRFFRMELIGEWETTTAVNAVRFALSSGNIASGTIRCYGIAKGVTI
jgi:hypothetical protein